MNPGTARKLIICLVAGVATGLFLGERAEVFGFFGEVYFLATQIAIIPFLISSLIMGLGKLTSGQALRLFKSAWKVFAIVWLVSLVVIVGISLAIPPTNVSVVRPEDPGSTGRIAKALVTLLIPSNPFAAIAQNRIPAIVLFCVAFGIALQTLPQKGKLLEVVEVVEQVTGKFWEWLVALVPLALFCSASSLFGMIEFHTLPQIVYYLAVAIVSAALLILWLLPAVAAALLDLPFSKVLGRLRAPLIIALVTNASPVALPASGQAIQRLMRGRVSDPEVHDVILTTLALAFVFMRCGEMFDHYFIAFAAYFYQEPLPILINLALLPVSILCSIGGAGPVLISSINSYGLPVQLPDSTALLYSQTVAVLDYPITMLSTMTTAVATLLAVMNYYGLLRVSIARLAKVLAGGAVALVCLDVAVFQIGARLQTSANNPVFAYHLPDSVTAGVDVTVVKPGEKIPDQLLADRNAQASLPTLERIEETGTLFVGYSADENIPFAYFNHEGALVGYDIAFMYALARDLGVRLVFVPFDRSELVNDLAARDFDIACSGIFLTSFHAGHTLPSDPYLRTQMALFGPMNTLKEAMNPASRFDLKVLDVMPLNWTANRDFPKWKQEVLHSYWTMPGMEEGQLALWGEVEALAYARVKPGIAVMELPKRSNPLLMSFLMPEDAVPLERIVDYQIENWSTSGEGRETYRYWILGEGALHKQPRWSVLHDVLGL